MKNEKKIFYLYKRRKLSNEYMTNNEENKDVSVTDFPDKQEELNMPSGYFFHFFIPFLKNLLYKILNYVHFIIF